MFRITFVLGGEQAYRDKAMRILLATLTFVNKTYFEEHLEAPSITKLAYQEEHAGEDDWRDASAVVRMGGGDCEDVACYAAGWLQARHGIEAWPDITHDAYGHTHTLVRLPSGKTFDPTLFMGQKRVPGEHHACTAHDKSSPEQRIVFVTDLFARPDKDYPLAHRTLTILLHALFLIDVEWLLRHPETPMLYESGVRYENEPPGQEDWQDWPTTLRLKIGDCEDLSNLRASELLVKQGIQARPSFIWKLRPSGANLYHIQTTHPDGSVEDPSRRLGMGG